MLKNYFKIAFRNLWKNKSTSMINMLGLGIAIFASILIFLYVNFEFSFDKFHAKSDRIYRVLLEDNNLGVSENLAGINFIAMGPALKDRLPEVLEQARVMDYGRSLITVEDQSQSFYTKNLTYSTGAFFNLFDFELLQGDPKTVLDAPRKAVINEEWKEKLFGSENPIGKTFKVDNEDIYEVTGILKNFPASSHLQVDILLSMMPTEADSNFARYLESWNNIGMPTYILLDRAESAAKVESELLPTLEDHGVTWGSFGQKLQPLDEVHLYSSNIIYDACNQNKTDIDYLYILILVAVFIVIIAAFNFMNLSTARSTNRAKEVGLRKVVGAVRAQMIFQFLLESTLLAFLSLIIGLALVEAFAPMLNLPIEGSFVLYFLSNKILLAGMLGVIFLLGIAAGIYPSFVLSSFKPIAVLRGSFGSSKSGIWMRRVLVVVQFTASIVMIIGTSVVYNQLSYIQNKNLGFQPDQIVNINLDNPDLQGKAETFKTELASLSGISSIGVSTSMPGAGFGRRAGMRPEGYEDNNTWVTSVLTVEDNYFNTLGMKIAEGRNFSKDFPSDQQESVIINQSAAKEIGWKEPIGKRFYDQDGSFVTVVGIIEDFHFENMQHKIEPLAISYNQNTSRVFSLKVNSANINSTLDEIKAVWGKIFPDYPFEYSFFDKAFAQLFENDRKFGALIANFTWLAIFIACLGLFGLAAFTGEQKIKEIGVRKVLGASVAGIMFRLSGDFIVLILISSIMAFPIAYYFLSGWLEGYVYRTELNPFLFMLSAIVALVVAVLTISFHTFRAANQNPVESLRNE